MKGRTPVAAISGCYQLPSPPSVYFGLAAGRVVAGLLLFFLPILVHRQPIKTYYRHLVPRRSATDHDVLPPSCGHFVCVTMAQILNSLLLIFKCSIDIFFNYYILSYYLFIFV